MSVSPLVKLDPTIRSHIVDFLSPKDKLALACTAKALKGLSPTLYEQRGAHVDSGKTTFQVYAPQAKKVSVILTSFGSKEHEVPMEKTASGVWNAVSSHAAVGRSYLYRVEDSRGKVMMRTDPFSFSVVNVPEVGQVQSLVVDRQKYQWGDGEWMKQRAGSKPLEQPLSIYEVHVKSWMRKGGKPLSYRELAPELIAYCKKMNFTHVELYGVMEHMHDLARGYQVTNYFAPYHPMGSSDDLKYLIDQMHQEGIGVIIDWIPAHFQHNHQSSDYSMSLHEFDGSDLFSAEPAPWGTRYFDFSKPESNRLLEASAIYWIDQLHIDALRYDAISAIVRRNGKNIEPGIAFLQKLNDKIHAKFPGVFTIAEETDGFPHVTKSTKEKGLGFDLKWGIWWSHDSRNYFRTPYAERSREDHHQRKILHFLGEVQRTDKMVLSHSHDDSDGGALSSEKTLYSCVSHAKNEGARFADLRNFFAWQTLAPGRGYLIHMGDEIGQQDSWYQRFVKYQSAVDWELMKQPSQGLRRGLQQCVSDLNALYRYHSALWKQGEEGFKLISEYGPNRVVAYHRGMGQKPRIAVIHNFSDKGYGSYDVPLGSSHEDPAMKGVKHVVERFNSDEIRYGGSGKFSNKQVEVVRAGDGQPTHFRMALPPLSTVVVEEEF